MKVFKSLKDEEIVKLIDSNKIGVIPTDTLYGLVATAMSPRIVEKIYELKERDKKKPLIVLISSKEQLMTYFGLQTPANFSFWPGRCSLILSIKKYPHLHRGGKTIAFRVPDKEDLIELLEKVGPLVAPSANLQNQEPAKTIKEAKNYFGKSVDFYVDQGELNSKPSTLIKFKDKKIEVLREGALNRKFFQ